MINHRHTQMAPDSQLDFAHQQKETLRWCCQLDTMQLTVRLVSSLVALDGPDKHLWYCAKFLWQPCTHYLHIRDVMQRECSSQEGVVCRVNTTCHKCMLAGSSLHRVGNRHLLVCTKSSMSFSHKRPSGINSVLASSCLRNRGSCNGALAVSL